MVKAPWSHCTVEDQMLYTLLKFEHFWFAEGQDSVSVEVGPDGYRINYINMQAPPEYNLQAESNKQQDTEPEQNYTLNKWTTNKFVVKWNIMPKNKKQLLRIIDKSAIRAR